MGEVTGISWTNATWNPVRGCERVSEGCRKCYAEVLAAKHSYAGGWGEGIAKWITRADGTKEARWTGLIRTIDHMLDAPLRWRTPKRIFVNSMSDLFHARVPFDFVDKVYAVMAACDDQQRGHIFQILTKRPERMLEYVTTRARDVWNKRRMNRSRPFPHVWHGVSAEDQKTFDERVEILCQVPTAVRFVSLEPLLGEIDVGNALDDTVPDGSQYGPIHWGIVGGESGHERRAMKIEHARFVIEQFKLWKKPIFVKQDNGPRPGMQGRFTAEEWNLKEYPETVNQPAMQVAVAA